MNSNGVQESMIGSRTEITLNRIAYCAPILWCSGLSFAPEFSRSIWQPEHFKLKRIVEQEIVKSRQNLKIPYTKVMLGVFASILVFELMFYLVLYLTGKLTPDNKDEQPFYLTVFIIGSFLYGIVLIVWLQRWTKKSVNKIKSCIEKVNIELKIKGLNAILKIKGKEVYPRFVEDSIISCQYVEVMEEVHSVEMS